MHYGFAVSLVVIFLFGRRSHAFVENLGLVVSGKSRSASKESQSELCTTATSVLRSSVGTEMEVGTVDNTPGSSHYLQEKIKVLCQNERVLDALELFQQAEKVLVENKAEFLPEESLYIAIFEALAKSSIPDAPDIADQLLETMVYNGKHDRGSLPSAKSYNVVISIWSKSTRKGAADKCYKHLQSLWSLHSDTNDKKFVPLKASYISTIAAFARSRQGREAATRAESLLEEMEELGRKYPQLSPDTICANTVL